MHQRTDPKGFHHSRQLRNNLTDEERLMWNALRFGPLAKVHFRRQHAIGKYIVDFCAPPEKIIIEIDGGQHFVQEVYDQERTRFLESKGYQVLRFWNNEVEKNIEGVLLVIDEAITKRTLT